MTTQQRADWDNRVQHHPPSSQAVIDAHQKARALIGQVGHELLDLLPPGSPEIDEVLRLLHDALMHANMAIALHHPDNVAE
jgi:hypothetical protein